MTKKNIALISTGGTIEKTYDELSGVLGNHVSVLDVMLSRLVLDGIEVTRVPLMHKDSLEMTEEDHQMIAETARISSDDLDGVVIVHGTDRLALTGEYIFGHLPEPRTPIVLTGAMRPWEMRRTDASQNLAEALLAVQILPPGVYAVMHNRALQFPGVVKDTGCGTFVYRDELEA